MSERIVNKIKCVSCLREIEPYQDKLSLVEARYDKNRRISSKTVGHYCWCCYEKEFMEVKV